MLRNILVPCSKYLRVLTIVSCVLCATRSIRQRSDDSVVFVAFETLTLRRSTLGCAGLHMGIVIQLQNQAFQVFLRHLRNCAVSAVWH